MIFENERMEAIKAGMKLDRYGLIALSGGNVSLRLPGGEIIVTPSGMIYEDLIADDVLVMDIDGNIKDGKRSASVDTQALLYIYKHMPSVNAIIHTHQPYATAVGLVADELPCCVTTLPNTAKGAVKVCPFSSAASIDMGIQTVKHAGSQLAVILKNHGVIALGNSLKQALYACIYLEEAAKTYVFARAMGGDISVLTPAQIKEAVDTFDSYGQEKGTM